MGESTSKLKYDSSMISLDKFTSTQPPMLAYQWEPIRNSRQRKFPGRDHV